MSLHLRLSKNYAEHKFCAIGADDEATGMQPFMKNKSAVGLQAFLGIRH